jgi:hypothetical protein
MRRAAELLTTILVALVATCAAVGWLYVIRNVAWLGIGPTLSGALPLQRLAGSDSQPLLRFAAAWVPTGLAVGWALRRLAPASSPRLRAALAGVTALVVLVVAGAASDAVTANETVSMHASAQVGHAATWMAAIVVAACAHIVGSRAR